MCGQDILSVLAYADDMVFLASTEEGLQDMLNIMQRFSEWTGLKVGLSDSKDKTAAFATNGTRMNLHLGGRTVPQLQNGEVYRYLGVDMCFAQPEEGELYTGEAVWGRQWVRQRSRRLR